ncbi:MAG: hypothetical protein QGG42_08575 [Phycisphaerae bacterium]|jgi:hypothetical protein|nr:hypothetical protein [Phycisphaerae bacterium]
MWSISKIIVFAVPFIVLGGGILTFILLKKTIRTRLRVSKQIREDPDINEWLVTFDWSRKVLYVPTIFASLIASLIVGLVQMDVLTDGAVPVIGGIWFAIFTINFLVDEYVVSIKVLLILILCVLAIFLWLLFLGWVEPFVRSFRHIGIAIDWMGYLLIAGLFSVAVMISYLRGLFYYVAITPNYMNIQTGPTETGEQISREEYSTRVDTGDFLERLFGFGRIIITFRDHRRQPMSLLVSRVGKQSQRLESIRGKLAMDRHNSIPPQEP